MTTLVKIDSTTVRDGVQQLAYAIDAYLTAKPETGLLLGVGASGLPTFKLVRSALPMYASGTIAASYGENGTVQVGRPSVSVQGMDVVLVDYSCVSGGTMYALATVLEALGARSVSGSVLLNSTSDKCLPGSFNLVRAFDVPDSDYFGFGGDLLGEFRNLDCVKGKA